MPVIAHLDFEASGVSDLRKVGSDVWTRRDDTHPTVVSFAIGDDPVDTLVFTTKNTHKSTAGALDRLDILTRPDVEIHAWNAAFEFQMWNNVCVRRYRWPELPLERFHCTMAQAACAGLPMSLDQAGQALGGPFRKDMAGSRNMKRLARPRKDDPLSWWHLSDDKLAQANLDELIRYNRNDVETERALYHATPRMTSDERAIWLIDQRMQLAGLPVDMDLLQRLILLTEGAMMWNNNLLDALTGGAVTSVNQHAKLLNWVRARGYPLDTLERDTLRDFVLLDKRYRKLPPEARAVLDLRYEASKTSTAKLNAIREFTQIDGAARHLSQYGGAVRTLRWAGRGIQIQNFPRPLFKEVDDAIDAIKQGADAQALNLIWGKPLDVVSTCLRGVFCAPKNSRLVVCDYSSIEARVVAWLALHGAMLKVFLRGDDIYVYAASQQGSDNRQFGKVLVLACGYGMGAVKFQETALDYGVVLTLNEADQAVQTWRAANWPIVQFWHACEMQAKRAIQNPNQTFDVNQRLKFRMARPDRKLAGALLMTLPSGRNIVYRDARIEDAHVTYNGVNQKTRKWETIRTYGGKLVENATQAVARDIMADALTAMSASGWGDALRQTVHDEIICMTREDAAQWLFDTMKQTMGTPPFWAKGLPLAVTGYVAERYGKG